jgi:hypothetical protein
MPALQPFIDLASDDEPALQPFVDLVSDDDESDDDEPVEVDRSRVVRPVFFDKRFAVPASCRLPGAIMQEVMDAELKDGDVWLTMLTSAGLTLVNHRNVPLELIAETRGMWNLIQRLISRAPPASWEYVTCDACQHTYTDSQDGLFDDFICQCMPNEDLMLRLQMFRIKACGRCNGAVCNYTRANWRRKRCDLGCGATFERVADAMARHTLQQQQQQQQQLASTAAVLASMNF